MLNNHGLLQTARRVMGMLAARTTAVTVLILILFAVSCQGGDPKKTATANSAALPTVVKGGPCTGTQIAHARMDRSEGKPNEGNVSFVAGGTVCIRATSGGPDPHAAASAHIVLDSVVSVAEPSDFNGHSTVAETQVNNLAAIEHVLTTRVASKPGTWVEVDVFDNDEVTGLEFGGGSASGTVGPTGGVITSSGAAGLLSVPPGALASPIPLSVGPIDSSLLATPPPSGLTIVGGVELTPDGMTFAEPVFLIVPIAEHLPPGSPLTPLYFDTSASAWVRSTVATGEYPPAVVTSDGFHAAFLADHFSSHAVALPTLPELDLVAIGSSNGVTHMCPIGFDFGVWDGPPINNLFGTALNDPVFRHNIYADLFEQVLLRPTTGDGSSLAAMAEQAIDSAENEDGALSTLDAGLTPFALHKNLNKVAKELWGLAADKPANFKYTTLTNVQARVGQVSLALQVLATAAKLDKAAAEVELLWVLSQAAELTRIDVMRSYLESTGLTNDSAIAIGFETAANRIKSRHDAQTDLFVAALQQSADISVAKLEVLLDAGWQIGLPNVIVSQLVKAKTITQSAGAKLAGMAGVAIELALGNGDAHRRQSLICAASTLHAYGLQNADVEVDGVPLTELKYITFAMLAHTAASYTAGEEHPPLHWLLYQAVNIFMKDQIAATIAFWKNAAQTAEDGLQALSSLKFGLDSEPMETILDDPFPSVGFRCTSDPSVSKISCGSPYVGCYSGPEGSWFWTYSVAPADCTATFELTATSSGKQPLFANYFAFCDQSQTVHYGVEDDYMSTQVVVDQYSNQLEERSSLLGQFHFTSGAKYKVHISDYDPLGYRATPGACQAAGGAHHINVNVDRISFTAEARIAPPLQISDREAIRVDGTSVLSWPFTTNKWHRTEGSEYHRCSDAFADDWNTNLGGCDTEITLGPMNVRAPIGGVVRFAGKSTQDPGRGHQIIIESVNTPGFFVGYAHLQPFDSSTLLGRVVAAGDPLGAAVGKSGTDCAHLHISVWRRVLEQGVRSRVFNGQSPESYSCDVSKYAARFELNPNW